MAVERGVFGLEDLGADAKGGAGQERVRHAKHDAEGDERTHAFPAAQAMKVRVVVTTFLVWKGREEDTAGSASFGSDFDHRKRRRDWVVPGLRRSE